MENVSDCAILLKQMLILKQLRIKIFSSGSWIIYSIQSVHFAAAFNLLLASTLYLLFG